ncbi:mannose-P-dolichol utilization defect 1 protein homolog [Teleopsis dalmanni]|uniref:mannose-P-dolichol utilization defect 1 protein homolog n=1 Tax=Teleopsis dalmanni TaxID=139649 RepID=UPI0018CC8128|nr:mannose-P-dolichol utilization defect 1 protein homolog [Teleopsis dalmanni]
MEVVKNFALLFLSPKCYDNYFVELDFMNGPCFKASLSKLLGLTIIAGSLLVKIPQVHKIWHKRSGEGINLVSVLFDLLAVTFQMSYSYMNGYPFSAWGDNTFLALQTVTIGALVLFYNGAKVKAFFFCLIYASVVYILNSGLTPMHVLIAVQSFNIPIVLIAKTTQALTNYRNGSTGQLSAITVFMLFAGTVARIFTSIQETGDKMIIMTYCVSTLANGVILAQVLYYWNSSTKTKKSKKQD